MVHAAIQQELLEHLSQLSIEAQRRVLHLARALALSTRPVGVPGRDLLALAGTMSADEAREIREAIETGCEQVDHSEW